MTRRPFMTGRPVAMMALVLLFATGCAVEEQAESGPGWRWLTTATVDDETLIRRLDDQASIEAFETKAGIVVPEVNVATEFVLVLSTRGRGVEAEPCGVYFRGVEGDPEVGELKLVLEADTSAEACDAAYVYGQYVIAVERDLAGPPPFDIIIDEPGQAGRPKPFTVES